ncbi:MAG: hypothetical protein PPP56_00235 [Longimonas sp.]|uniref:hypothetical protein n=1 Tax=Longimonas sp. TaxID=2039626 RepID=UPI00334BBCBC
MATSSSESDIAPIPQVGHTGAQVDTHLRTALNKPRPCIVLAGGTRGARQATFARILDASSQNALQFRAQSLLGERREHTQNSLRKAFDSATEEHALLFIDPLDPLFTWKHANDMDDLPDDAIPSTVEYFLQRVESYPYPAILGIDNPSYISSIRKTDVHLVVSHEGASESA